MNKFSNVVLLSWLLTAVAAQGALPWPQLSGPYLGQTPPGDAPELFAPGLVSTSYGDRDVIISPDGTEIYFCMLDRVGVYVRVTRLVDGVWTKPTVPSFSTDSDFGCLEITMSGDGQVVHFLSTRALPDEPKLRGWGNQNIFFSKRTAEGWSEPEPSPGAVNTMGDEYYPSLTSDGTMYFTKAPKGAPAVICRSRLVNGAYAEPEELPVAVNCAESSYNAFVAPDESYLIACIRGKEKSLPVAGYYISFRNADDQWSEAINLGPHINKAESAAGSAYVSPDGKYLFFSANWPIDKGSLFGEEGLTYQGIQDSAGLPALGSSDIYWVSASFLDDLRPAGWEK
ncbi:MAG: hypothetical protein GY780_08745 [bacterium]|nr:hypothetical protein [bacterium]